jgi:hypothetical protein
MDLFSQLFAGVTVTVSLGDALALGGVIIGFVAWLVRLENKASNNEGAIQKLEKADIERKIELEKKDAERKAEIDKIEQAVWDKFESVQHSMNQRFETAQNTMNQVLVSLGELKGLIGGKKDAG